MSAAVRDALQISCSGQFLLQQVFGLVGSDEYYIALLDTHKREKIWWHTSERSKTAIFSPDRTIVLGRGKAIRFMDMLTFKPVKTLRVWNQQFPR